LYHAPDLASIIGKNPVIRGVHLIGHLRGVAAKHRVLFDRTAARDGDKIADRRVFPAGAPDHPVANAF
jgi:hypothetical protein